jgi:predicted Rossmann-fold nucleotide-binding protein
MKDIVLKARCISPSDLDIFSLVDTPEEAVRIIKRRVVA